MSEYKHTNTTYSHIYIHAIYTCVRESARERERERKRKKEGESENKKERQRGRE